MEAMHNTMNMAGRISLLVERHSRLPTLIETPGVTVQPLLRDRPDRPRRVSLGAIVRQDERLDPPLLRCAHQAHEISTQVRQRLLHAVVWLGLLYRGRVAAPRR